MPPVWRHGLPGNLDCGLCPAARPRRGHHPVHIECEPALVEGDRQDLGHALGHADRRGQPQHRVFPRGERAFGGDVTKRSDKRVTVRGTGVHPVDVRCHPHQAAVAMPDRRFVLHLVLHGQLGLLDPGRLVVDQPWMRPVVGQAVGRVTGEFGKRVVDLDDRAAGLSDEESLLQGIHHRVAELVAIGKILCAGPLLFVTPCASEESACRDVERGQGL